MKDLAVCVERLSKLYHIGRREGYKTLRDALTGVLAAPLRALASTLGRTKAGGRARDDFIWALKDVSFEVRTGEVVGIIGANGAGKTTLLKILSRITEPTEGHADVYGRVGSLLEVGTGFHPELTGRENVYLNGAILGMKRSEIDGRFDEIVAFAEVEKFIDTPVKRYSTGMHVRLAFSVAAHLNPDILVVDEVLAVGDAGFRRKCLGKMGQVAGSGRTVLLVSHNMGAIRAMASTAIWLHQGRLVEIGDPREVVNKYLAVPEPAAGSGFYDKEHVESRRVRAQKYARQVTLQSVRVRDAEGRTSAAHLENADVFLEMEMTSEAPLEALEILIRVRTLEGQMVFTALPGKREARIAPGTYKAVVRFNLSPLLPGVYQGDVVLLSHLPQDNVSPAFQLEIVPNPAQPEDDRMVVLPSATAAPESIHSTLGLIRVRASWEEFSRVSPG